VLKSLAHLPTLSNVHALVTKSRHAMTQQMSHAYDGVVECKPALFLLSRCLFKRYVAHRSEIYRLICGANSDCVAFVL
jgi:hypothetical protein